MGIFAPSISGNGQAAYVATSEATTSLSYTNLTTTTDTVTITIGASGTALVFIYSRLVNSATNGASYVGIDVSGANTIAAADDRCLLYQAYGASTQNNFGATFLYTGLSQGSTTFKMKYKVNGNTGTFQDRRIAAVPL